MLCKLLKVKCLTLVLRAHALKDGQVKVGYHLTIAESHSVFLTRINFLTRPSHDYFNQSLCGGNK